MRSNLPALALCLIVAIAAVFPVDSLPAKTLVWNTFMGGTGSDTPAAVARDTDGNVYVTGDGEDTWGVPVRAYSKSRDAFVAKLDSNGNRVWVTFLGGLGVDTGQGIAVSTNDKNVYVSGTSDATWGEPLRDFTANRDAFVAKIDAITGELLWSTFVGGAGYDEGTSITASGTSYVYMAGSSSAAWGSPVQAFNGGGDALVVQLDAEDGSLVWHTFLGGTDYDYSGAITTWGSLVFVTGATNGQGWSWEPIRQFSGAFDAFVARLDPSTGLLFWYTFLGGTGDERGKGIAFDANGTLIVAGGGDATWGSPIQAFAKDPVDTQITNDGFAAGLNPSSGIVVWNTFMGSTKDDAVLGISADAIGGVYLVGSSSATWGSPATAYGGGAFAARLEASTGVRTWNAFLSSNADNTFGVTSDANGNLDVIGSSQITWGSPVDAHALGIDAFVARVSWEFIYGADFESL